MNRERLLQVILGPVVSEKATMAADRGNQVVFKVTRDATKKEIKTAVADLFKVTVEDVRVLNRKGKTKRSRTGVGKQSTVRKAYVRLAEGHDINFETIE